MARSRRTYRDSRAYRHGLVRRTRQEVATLIANAQAGDRQALSDVVDSFYRMVVKLAMRYRDQAGSMTPDDLVGYGTVGLLNAIAKFDTSRIDAFSTYAYKAIRNEITKAIYDLDNLIRIPESAARRDAQAVKDGGEREQRCRHAPGVDIASIAAEVTEPAREGEAGCEEAMKVARTLGEQELWVLTEKFGLNGAEPRSLEAIGRDIGRSKERIRQIRDKALSRLRVALTHDLNEERKIAC